MENELRWVDENGELATRAGIENGIAYKKDDSTIHLWPFEDQAKYWHEKFLKKQGEPLGKWPEPWKDGFTEQPFEIQAKFWEEFYKELYPEEDWDWAKYWREAYKERYHEDYQDFADKENKIDIETGD